MATISLDPKTAVKNLEKNRKDYILKLFGCLKESIDRDDYFSATCYIVEASDMLKVLNGAVDYLNAFDSSGRYPEFRTIFE